MIPSSLSTRIFSMTWNVNGKYPPQDMRRALGLESANLTDLPDVYVIGLQEAPIGNGVNEDAWTSFFRSTFSSHGYMKINEVKMQAIQLFVFCRRNLLTKIRDVEINWTRTGFGGWWGNKGGVSIRMTVNGCHICFLSCHFAAHDHKLEQRISDYKKVVYGQRFEGGHKRVHVLSHEWVWINLSIYTVILLPLPDLFYQTDDIIFSFCFSFTQISLSFNSHVVLLGDLNFRIDDFSSNEIYTKIVEGSSSSLDELLSKDQVRVFCITLTRLFVAATISWDLW